GDNVPLNNVQNERTTVTAGADLALTLSGPATAAAGSGVTLSLTATNNGPDPVTTAVVQFDIPSGLANVVPPPGCALTGSTYFCTIAGPIALGASVTLNFDAQIAAASNSTITAVGSVEDVSPEDPVVSNNTDTLDIEVTEGSDVFIVKDRVPASGTVLVGDPVAFRLSAGYTGDDPSGLVITDTLPANYSVVSTDVSAAPGWDCAVLGQTITCTRATGSGPGANVSLGTIVINTTATDAGSATNEATITSTGPLDPDLANNTDSDGGAVIEVPNVDLEARKSGPSPALVVVGNSYDFAISVANRGNTAFFGTVVMTDSLPAGLEVTGYTQNGWTCLPAASPAVPVVGADTITCTRIYTEASPLGAGQATPPVILQTTATAEGVIVNSLTVTTPFTNLEDLNLANNIVTYGVTGSTGDNSADIATIKTADLATLPVGEVQTFTIEVTNTGPQPSTAITLTDNLVRLINNAEGPDGAGLVSIAVAANAASGVACTAPVTGGTSRRLECTIDTLPICTPGADCPVITIAVRPGGEGGERTNTARAISSAVADR
ncbi:MAG: hypothetical protein B7Y02_08350, partial [Rhodobacterales bacterium 17-64-5]